MDIKETKTESDKHHPDLPPIDWSFLCGSFDPDLKFIIMLYANAIFTREMIALKGRVAYFLFLALIAVEVSAVITNCSKAVDLSIISSQFFMTVFMVVVFYGWFSYSVIGSEDTASFFTSFPALIPAVHPNLFIHHHRICVMLLDCPAGLYRTISDLFIRRIRHMGLLDSLFFRSLRNKLDLLYYFYADCFSIFKPTNSVFSAPILYWKYTYNISIAFAFNAGYIFTRRKKNTSREAAETKRNP